MPFLPSRYAHLQAQIQNALERYHRPADSVTLLGVTKSQPANVILQAANAGLIHTAENYVQEALPKISALASQALIWHFIGTIQTNKIKAIAHHFSWVHTLCRLKEAEQFAQLRLQHNAPSLNVLIQVKLDTTTSRSGIPPKEVPALVEAVRHLPGIKLRGLMALPPISQDFQQQRQQFRRVFQLFQNLKQQYNLPLDTLSMGMSHDFIAAIAEGSTMLRIGTALFGQRNTHP